MNNPSTCLANLVYLRQSYTLALLTCLSALLGACTANRLGVANGQKLRLNVGDIKEVAMTPPRGYYLATNGHLRQSGGR